MAKKTFIVYADWIDYTTEMNLEEKWLFFQTIMNYYNWIEVWDIWPIKFIWSKIKKQIDDNNSKREEVLEKRKIAGKKWWLAKSSKTKQKLASAKIAKENLANLAVTDTVNVTDTVTDNEKKEITLSKDKETKVYWNEDVNLCLDLIKWVNGWIVDWTKKEQRQYAKHLINKINKLDKIASWEWKRDDYLSGLLALISKSKYDIRKISSPKKIYYDLASLQQVANQMYWEVKNPKKNLSVSKINI